MISKLSELIIEADNNGYTVNKYGEVFSMNGKKLKLMDDGRGYLRFSIRIPNIGSKSVRVHRFVAYKKFGEELFNAECVRHLDGNSKNNSFENIEIGTLSENSMDIPQKTRIRVSSMATQKYSIETVLEIREKYNNGDKRKDIMREYKISSTGTFWSIIHKRLINY